MGLKYIQISHCTKTITKSMHTIFHILITHMTWSVVERWRKPKKELIGRQPCLTNRQKCLRFSVIDNLQIQLQEVVGASYWVGAKSNHLIYTIRGTAPNEFISHVVINGSFRNTIFVKRRKISIEFVEVPIPIV